MRSNGAQTHSRRPQGCVWKATGPMGLLRRTLVAEDQKQNGQHVWHDADQQLGAICCCMANESPPPAAGSVRCMKPVTVDVERQIREPYERPKFTAISCPIEPGHFTCVSVSKHYRDISPVYRLSKARHSILTCRWVSMFSFDFILGYATMSPRTPAHSHSLGKLLMLSNQRSSRIPTSPCR